MRQEIGVASPNLFSYWNHHRIYWRSVGILESFSIFMHTRVPCMLHSKNTQWPLSYFIHHILWAGFYQIPWHCVGYNIIQTQTVPISCLDQVKLLTTLVSSYIGNINYRQFILPCADREYCFHRDLIVLQGGKKKDKLLCKCWKRIETPL